MPPASKKLMGHAGLSLSVKSGLVKVYGMVKVCQVNRKIDPPVSGLSDETLN